MQNVIYTLKAGYFLWLNKKSKIFMPSLFLVYFLRSNYLYFFKKIEKHLLKHCDLLAYCLMPNHFHFLIETKDNLKEESINKAIQTILSSYTQGINKQEDSTGSLFQQHTKSKLLDMNDPAYAAVCFHYIHQNPLRVGLVKRMEKWEFSSMKEYCCLTEQKLCNQDRARLLFDLPVNKEKFLMLSNQVISEDIIRSSFEF